MRAKQLTGELEGLYRGRYRQFLRVAIAIVGDEAGAHDAVQEAFARALRSVPSYRADGSLEAWLWQIVLNAARAARRSEAAARKGSELDETSSAGNGSAVHDDNVRAWVAALPERQRLTVFLRYYADLDYRSIASALGVEVGTVSATLNAAHESLRRSLKEAAR